ncbi:MAG: DEAD/DEAH box helicase [Thermofilum sp.]
MTECFELLSRYFGPQVARLLVEKNGIKALYPTQEAAIKSGLLDGENLVLAAPTASGKTLVAELAALKHLLSGGKVLYLTPLRALASEKYREFSEFFGIFGYRVAVSTGDYDTADPHLGRYHVIIATNEKADSLLRHKAPWFKELTLIIADEIHTLGMEKRGAVLEVLLTRAKTVLSRAQFLGLSATIRNVEELADWLGAKPLRVDWRPVPLREGVYYDGVIYYQDGSSRSIAKHSDPLLDLAVDTLEEGGQVLVFSPTRKSAISDARKLASVSRRFLEGESSRKLKESASRIVQHHSDKISETLAKLVREGVAFHHAGLSLDARDVVETLFRERVLKVVVATPTLAAGVNLPARRVIIVDYRRYDVELGYYERIPVMEYKQMAGRAGRPGFDKEGDAVLIARSFDEAEMLLEEYVKAPPERIYSQLGSEAVLRSQVLSVVATSEELSDESGVEKLFVKTLHAHQFGPLAVQSAVSKTLKWLRDSGFVEKSDGEIRATPLGRRVAELYIDPLTADMGKRFFSSTRASTPLTYLLLLSSTPDAMVISARKKDYDYLETVLEQRGNELPRPPDDELEYYDYLSRLKTALLLEDWINEVREEVLVEKYDVGPGDLYFLTQTAVWIAYSLSQVAEILGYAEHAAKLGVLSKRLEHGVREELLELVSLKGVGRVRARSLYNHGYRSILDLLNASVDDLARVPGIGPTLAKSIKAQLEPERRDLLEDSLSEGLQGEDQVQLDSYF